MPESDFIMPEKLTMPELYQASYIIPKDTNLAEKYAT